MWRGRRAGPQGVEDQESHGGGVQSKAARQHLWGVSGRLYKSEKRYGHGHMSVTGIPGCLKCGLLRNTSIKELSSEHR